MQTLIVGGTSGLGLELGREFREAGDDVVVTGRRELDEPGIEVVNFDLTEPDLVRRIGELTLRLPHIDTVVYAAGYSQDGLITDLDAEEIDTMIDVGGRSLIFFIQALLDKQHHIDELITIGSTSQWTPRKREPVYNFVKAGAALFTEAIAQDDRVDATMLVGPSGMNTNFWEGSNRDDLEEMLDPVWVAQQIVELNDDDFSFKSVKILRNPDRVEVDKVTP